MGRLMNGMRGIPTRLCLGTLALFAPLPAYAHPGHSGQGHFLDGFLHPFSGWDHLAAMIAAGVFAAVMAGRALWAVPLSFLTLMVAGMGLALGHVALPFVEFFVTSSAFVFGLALVTHKWWTVQAAAALFGAFAIFHGYAHGVEMPPNTVAAAYAFGFLAASALLQLAGMAIGLTGRRSGLFAGSKVFPHT